MSVWSKRKRTVISCVHGRIKAWEYFLCAAQAFFVHIGRGGERRNKGALEVYKCSYEEELELNYWEMVCTYISIMENKWAILLVLEIFAWSATMFMFYARYKMQSQFWFKIASTILVLTGVIPQVFLGVINLIVTKEIDLFTLVIVLLIIYGFTVGKKHIQTLDAWAQKKFSG